MGFRCGIVGLPNIGKSTLFNALTNTISAEVGNYPFCTVEPHIGRVAVPDPELSKLAKIADSKTVIPTQLEIVDIAGLVKGANKGEGLGNQFLANIREVDAIVHLTRCFEDEKISHVEGNVDPIRDIELIETELMLADLESLERQYENLTKKSRGGDKSLLTLIDLASNLIEEVKSGRPIRDLDLDTETQLNLRKFQLLTSKPILYACNVDEKNIISGNIFSQLVMERAEKEGNKALVISAAIESEISALEDFKEKIEFLEALGIEESGLNRLIKIGYELLGLIRYYTIGPKESKAWTIANGTTAREAAGKIHTDFAKGFICAETIAYTDYISCGNEQAAKEAGKMRQEGRDYVVKNGDILLFRFNV